MTDHKIRVFDTSGVLKYELTDELSLSVIKVVNAPGMMTIDLSGYHALSAAIVDKWQLEYWRRPEGQSWAREFTGLFRKSNWKYTDLPKDTLSMLGLMSMLGWRRVAYHANTTNRSKFTSAKAETIANTLAKYNATSAGALDRLRSGAISGMSVEADGAEGNTLDWYCAYDNLLATLQDLCKVGGGDFDLVKTSSTTWQWRWYTGQLGTDRSATVIFSMERGNMAEPEYDEDHIAEATVAIVGGKGEEASRQIEIRTGVDYNVTSNNIETFVDARNIDSTAGLNARGDQKLDDMKAIRNFSFKVLQTPACLYGVHYFLGDIVAAINPKTGTSQYFKVLEVAISLAKDGSEEIDVKLVASSGAVQ